ncbi:Glycosyl hydrolases family 11 [Ruminococcus flavefaciens]|uniref:endo-1,4-beta-xylanase n=1 Tax=Ruminococcus flavefaciens TaxID=1265 RepID=A0A1H6KBX6_RUMFL|nr:glycoside hydrolase family 11 protein [Ruminococcus flavefaciens]SEH69276.1 Glycosyl hydrolases family 11 [Ruminococcus flavefaciens]
MNKCMKKMFSAMTAAAVCAVNMTVFPAYSGIIIDHNSSGVDKGYYYEFTNNDKDGTACVNMEPGGYYECSWGNEETFSTARGWKFASPVKYSDLGYISLCYMQYVNIDGFYSKDGYVRFGIRVRNSDGKTFTILEQDESSDKLSIAEKNDGYEKIGSLECVDEFKEKNIWGEFSEVKKQSVDYTLYSFADENSPMLYRRDESLEANFFNDNTRWVCVSDKLDAMAAAGCDIGDITDITLFVEAAQSKGDARIYMSEIEIENMHELVQHECEDEEAPLILRGYYDDGVRTDHYYNLSSGYPARMQVLAPSLFKADWDSTENKYNNDPVFQRGKQYKEGQSYKAVANSSIDYSMNMDVEGKYFTAVYADIVGPQTDEYNYAVDIYIVDAYQDWSPNYVEKVGELTADEQDYDVYYVLSTLVGSFKPVRRHTYYFISKDAEENGRNGKVSAKHELAPFTEFIKEKGTILGEPATLTAFVNGGTAKGSVELVKNEVTIPEFTPDDGYYARELSKVSVDSEHRFRTLDDVFYDVEGENVSMEGYAGEKIDCKWQKGSEPWSSSGIDKEHHSFSIIKDRIDSFDWNDIGGVVSFTDPASDDSQETDAGTADLIGGFKDDEKVYVDYSVDLGELSDEGEESNVIIGGYVQCHNNDYQAKSSWNGFFWDNGECQNYNILIADKWDKEIGTEIIDFPARDVIELGTIESDGVVYNVKEYYPEAAARITPYIIVSRAESLAPSEAEDIPEKFTRYENTICITDIVEKLKAFDLKLHTTQLAGFQMHTFHNAGSAVINTAEIKVIPDEEKLYTADDVQKLKDFILGKKVDIDKDTNYDLNGDGLWDTYDLCLMRNRIEK